MAKSLSPDETHRLLSSGDLEALKGAYEHEAFDAKQTPYVLTADTGKYELAKDVTAFANADGGVIVMGFKTDRPDPAHSLDTVVSVHPFPAAMLQPDQYYDVLRSWTFPKLDLVRIEHYPEPSSSTHVVAAIYVERDRQRGPFFVTKSVSAAGKVEERLFGFTERRRAGTILWSVQEVQTAFKLGLGGNEDLVARLEAAVAKLETMTAGNGGQALPQAVPPPPMSEPPVERPSFTSAELTALGSAAVVNLGLQSLPAIYFVARPTVAASLDGFLTSRSPAALLVEHPPEFRKNGFDLTTGGRAQLVEGSSWRAALSEYKLLEIFRDGTTVFAARGDEEFLAWNSHSGADLRVNPLTLAEVVLAFATLVSELAKYSYPPVVSIEYGIGVERLARDGNPAVIVPHRLSSIGWSARLGERRAPTASYIWPTRRVNMTESPESVAAKLLQEIYAWFGVPSDQMPYVVVESGEPRVSLDMIRSPNG